mmetsp:Transcript_11958/g.19160  ORF Transcript_11958/g.19160 Transcript_11958/m.19160 type:complete len:144 (-) Transcript_11958:172-603(-)
MFQYDPSILLTCPFPPLFRHNPYKTKTQRGEDVLRPSLAIVRAFMLRELQHNAAGEVHGNDKGKNAGYAHGIVKSLKEWKSFECKDCGRTLHGSHEFQEHLKSRGHRKRKAKLAKIERQKRCAADVRKARAMARLQKEEQANK